MLLSALSLESVPLAAVEGGAAGALAGLLLHQRNGSKGLVTNQLDDQLPVLSTLHRMLNAAHQSSEEPARQVSEHPGAVSCLLRLAAPQPAAADESRARLGRNLPPTPALLRSREGSRATQLFSLEIINVMSATEAGSEALRKAGAAEALQGLVSEQQQPALCLKARVAALSALRRLQDKCASTPTDAVSGSGSKRCTPAERPAAAPSILASSSLPNSRRHRGQRHSAQPAPSSAPGAKKPTPARLAAAGASRSAATAAAAARSAAAMMAVVKAKSPKEMAAAVAAAVAVAKQQSELAASEVPWPVAGVEEVMADAFLPGHHATCVVSVSSRPVGASPVPRFTDRDLLSAQTAAALSLNSAARALPLRDSAVPNVVGTLQPSGLCSSQTPRVGEDGQAMMMGSPIVGTPATARESQGRATESLIVGSRWQKMPDGKWHAAEASGAPLGANRSPLGGGSTSTRGQPCNEADSCLSDSDESWKASVTLSANEDRQIWREDSCGGGTDSPRIKARNPPFVVLELSAAEAVHGATRQPFAATPSRLPIPLAATSGSREATYFTPSSRVRIVSSGASWIPSATANTSSASSGVKTPQLAAAAVGGDLGPGSQRHQPSVSSATAPNVAGPQPRPGQRNPATTPPSTILAPSATSVSGCQEPFFSAPRTQAHSADPVESLMGSRGDGIDAPAGPNQRPPFVNVGGHPRKIKSQPSAFAAAAPRPESIAASVPRLRISDMQFRIMQRHRYDLSSPNSSVEDLGEPDQI